LESIAGLEIIELDEMRDERGWVVFPFQDQGLLEGRIKNIHAVSMAPGTVRGNHFHLRQKERIVIIGGPCLFAAQNPGSGERFETTFDPDPGDLIMIEPGVAHAIKNISGSPAYLLCGSELPFDPRDPDTSRHVLLE